MSVLPGYQVDPVYRNSLREARFILCLWACCFCYTLTYCYLFGYTSHEPSGTATGPAIGSLFGDLESFNRDPNSVTYPLGLGIPDWVFYGIGVPWTICIIASFWYGLFMFAEDELGGEDEETKDGVAK